jgi:hypothetical protein
MVAWRGAFRTVLRKMTVRQETAAWLGLVWGSTDSEVAKQQALVEARECACELRAALWAARWDGGRDSRMQPIQRCVKGAGGLARDVMHHWGAAMGTAATEELSTMSHSARTAKIWDTVLNTVRCLRTVSGDSTIVQMKRAMHTRLGFMWGDPTLAAPFDEVLHKLAEGVSSLQAMAADWTPMHNSVWRDAWHAVLKEKGGSRRSTRPWQLSGSLHTLTEVGLQTWQPVAPRAVVYSSISRDRWHPKWWWRTHGFGDVFHKCQWS